MRAALSSVAGLAVLFSGAGASAGKLAIEAPERVAGDGATEVPIRIELRGRGRMEEVKLAATAGTVGEAVRKDREAVIAFVPPRVARETRVRLTALARVGRRRLRARARLVVEAAPLPPGERGGDGPLGLEAPERLLLGAGASATIELTGGEEAPLLAASVGEVSRPVRAGGRWRATYTAPKERYPQVALIVASSADGSAFDWRTLDLFGRGRVDLEGEVRAAVTVRVGDFAFGPINLGRDGRARMPIFSPPGVSAARTVATDPLGNESRGRIEIRSPPFPRLLATCPAPGDRLRVFAVRPDGEPAAEAELALSPGRGELAPPRRVAPGVFEAHYHAPPELEVGEEVEFEAALPGRAGRSACTATISGERPGGIELSLGRTRHRAGQGRRIPVAVDLVYPGRLPPLAAGVEVYADLGSIGEVTRATDRSYRTVWILPDELDGREEATLRAVLADDRSVEAAASVALAPGEPARLELAGPHAVEGREVISARLRDRFGNRIRGAKLEGSARGRLGPFREAEPGTYRASYRAPDQGGADRILVRAPGAGLQETLLVRGPDGGPELQLLARGGYLDNRGKVAAPFVAVGASLRPPILERRLDLSLEAGLYSSRSREPVDEDRDAVTEVLGVPILGRAAYVHSPGGAELYGGGAFGLVHARAELSAPRAGRVAFRRTLPAFGLFLGGSMATARGRVHLEVGYLRAVLDEPELSGNVAGWFVGAGWAFTP